MNYDKPIKIDVDEVIRERAARYYRFIPKGLIRWLERTICQDRLNWLLENNRGKTGADFCRGVLHDLNVSVEYSGEDLLPPASDRRVLFVCNHPLGGLDGIALIDYVERRYGVAPRFIVNDLLMAIKPLNDVFVPINKIGSQSRMSAKAVDEAFGSDAPVIIFPAGLVSRRQKGGEIKDLQWQKMFVKKACKYQRDIIPMFFCGENSPFFYKFAKFRQRIGLKFNIEMIYLPREVFRCSDQKFSVIIGQTVGWRELSGMGDACHAAGVMRDKVYSLKPKS